jgi:hypothetical protein
MAKAREIGNRELAEESVPAPDADFAEVIYPFAMSYPGYAVWGDQETCWATGVRDWDRQEAGSAPPASLTKLRTALFSAGRAMRFIDFDEDITWDATTLPESYSAPGDAPGSGAVWEARMRDLVRAIATEVGRTPPSHLMIARSVAVAAERIGTAGPTGERGLQVALGSAIGELLEEPVASSATGHEVTFASLPFWAESDPPGPFDVVVGDPSCPRIAAELKWAGRNTLSHALWDVLKLLAVLSLSAEQVYLIAGYPDRVWKKAEFALLFEDGIVPYTKLPLAKEWRSLLEESKGTPTRIPNEIEITAVTCISLTHAGERWQLRAVAVDPAPGGWLELRNGRLEDAPPLS